MRKILLLILSLALLALPVCVSALELPVGKIAIKAQPIDYVSALAGIAKPVVKTYAENERYALLVTLDVPAYLPLDGLEMKVTANGCTVEDAGNLSLASGSYIIHGTVLVPGATVCVSVKDHALEQAQNAEQLWAAVNSDRSVSLTAVLGSAKVEQPSKDISIEIPKTGDRSVVGAGIGACALALLCFVSFVCGKEDER